ncbi:MAG: hypothetical protein HYZ53_09505 [Planctomycetes bacterium]|nr:hypothetical protein [Planctomycetota bacterium]
MRALRGTAAAVLLAELKRLAGTLRKRGIQDHDVEDAVAQIIYKLTRGGPREGSRARTGDSEVRAYLCKALKNEGISIHEDNRGLQEFGDFDPPAPATHRELEPEAESAQALFERLVHHVAAGMQARAATDLRATVAELLGLVRKEIRTADLIPSGKEGPAGKDPAGALHQRHTRARERLLLGVGEMYLAKEVSLKDGLLLERMVGCLKRR